MTHVQIIHQKKSWPGGSFREISVYGFERVARFEEDER